MFYAEFQFLIFMFIKSLIHFDQFLYNFYMSVKVKFHSFACGYQKKFVFLFVTLHFALYICFTGILKGNKIRHMAFKKLNW